MLAFSTQVRGFKPGRRRRIFKAKKILSTPSFGGEGKPSVPCRRFEACKRYLNLRGSRNLGKIIGQFLALVPPFAARISRIVADVQAPGGGSGNVSRRGKAMVYYPKNLPRMQCAKAIPFT